jgi:3-hydroxybutyryl-CoA dehydrogenase
LFSEHTVMSRIVILGNGAMGAAIAAGFLAHGADVILLGRDAARLAAAVPAVLRGTGAGAEARLRTALLDAWTDWDGVDLVIETVAEDLVLKQSLFRALDARVPSPIPIGSNSSSFGIGEIAAGLATRARMCNVHFLMPADVVPLVEVALGVGTLPAVGDAVCDLLRAHGKRPVLIRRDIPGLLAARLQHALMREAHALVEAGVVGPDDIDDAVRYGFGFRYAALGPMAQKEMSGWHTHVASARAVYPSLANDAAPPAWLTGMVETGRIGMASGAGLRTWSAQEAADFRARVDARLKAALGVLAVAPDDVGR